MTDLCMGTLGRFIEEVKEEQGRGRSSGET